MGSIISNENQITLKVKKTKKFLFLNLIFLSLFGILGVFFIILIIFSNGTEGAFGYIVIFLIYIASSIYLLRLALWNRYGKEILTFQNNQIIYTADYKLFKDKIAEFDKDSFSISILKLHKDTGKFLFKDKTQKIESSIISEIKDLNEIKKQIQNII